VISTIDRRAECRDRALKVLADLPPFSPVLNRLLATLGDENVSYARVADTIEKDTVVAGNILKLVNSAMYGRSAAITSVRHAVSLLGVAKLRNAVFSLSVSRMWSHLRTPPGWSMARFNLHCVGVAILADLMAQRVPVAYAEGAFVAGLFHDLGKLLIAFALPEEYEHIQAAGSQESQMECELNELGFTHAELSAEAVAKWKLPAPVRLAVQFHHAPALDCSERRPGERRLSLALSCANEYVNAAGITGDGKAQSGAREPLSYLAPLELDEVSSCLVKDFEQEFEAITPFFR
jgi:putative nucleotidyltransferase with HDIG domain